MIRLTALALLACACAAPVDAPPAEAPAAPVLALPLELADAGAMAAGLWLRAGYAVPAPLLAEPGEPLPAGSVRVLLAHGLIAGCVDDGRLAWGCTEMPIFAGDTTIVHISDAVPAPELVSVLAHEVGHTLGLAHTSDGSIMDPNRPQSAFERPCVGTICL